MGQIVGELLLLKQPAWSWTELFYFAIAVSMIMLGLPLWRTQRGRCMKRSFI
jgi:hypothetical protein